MGNTNPKKEANRVQKGTCGRRGVVYLAIKLFVVQVEAEEDGFRYKESIQMHSQWRR